MKGLYPALRGRGLTDGQWFGLVCLGYARVSMSCDVVARAARLRAIIRVASPASAQARKLGLGARRGALK